MKFQGVSALFSLCIHGLLAILSVVSLPNHESEKQGHIEVVWVKPTEAPQPKIPLVQKEKKQQHQKTKEITVTQKLAPKSSPRSESHNVAQAEAGSEQTSVPQPQVRLAHKPLPSYPWVCRKRHQEGIVLLKVQTNAEGGVEDISLHQSSGHSRLDEVALATVKSWTFVESHSEKILSIVFRLKA